MRKEEFLQSLRRSLSGDVPSRVIEENIRYYKRGIERTHGRRGHR